MFQRAPSAWAKKSIGGFIFDIILADYIFRSSKNRTIARFFY
jgi:hypothetical protein